MNVQVFARRLYRDETWLYFDSIPNKRSNQMWVAADRRISVVLRPGFLSRKRPFSVFFPAHRVQSWLTFYHRSQHSLQHTVLKLLPEVMKSIRQQRKTVGTSKTLLFHDKASAYKAKVTVTFLKEQKHPGSGPSSLQS